MRAVSLKEMGVPLSQRLREFPWMLSDLIFPFMGEYLVRPFKLYSPTTPKSVIAVSTDDFPLSSHGSSSGRLS